ncbi:MAG: bifunctional diaminohydroxyphosphoribosylaminopyrimidine deaminase/5-amino-6-(5-phosphoribosylamino)uracil reductase RibD, partial [Pseudomonadota bacterium]|nr:bifunctional diaminohydroxyphosphoribosylaminopyrimidine deaminase/5-amino-6-(5-phosphoribosylamino)uracil reductase RibD [Pseudomonadota bacterium]
MKRDADTDKRWMSAALNLARRGLGNVWPNPAVGCVVVSQGRVVGRGWTQPGGRPHAEAMALAAAGPAAAGGCAYVTLEPCAHHGRTPPCADALIAARLARVVYAVGDPDPRVAGAGAARMKAAGLAVETDVLADAAYALNLGFFSRVTRRRPMFTLKMATSLDGRIATRTGASQWITGPAARAHGHRLRAEHDAIMVGSGTAVADDPALTCRLPGLRDRSPLRVLCDSGLRTSPTSKMFADQTAAATWVATTEAAAAADSAMTASGARL